MAACCGPPGPPDPEVSVYRAAELLAGREWLFWGRLRRLSGELRALALTGLPPGPQNRAWHRSGELATSISSKASIPAEVSALDHLRYSVLASAGPALFGQTFEDPLVALHRRCKPFLELIVSPAALNSAWRGLGMLTLHRALCIPL